MVDLTTTLLYDPIGRLRQRATVGTTAAPIQSLYDGVNLIAEYDAANILQRRFVHGPGVDEPLVQYEGVTTTNKSWFYADHQGSVVATADSAGVPTGVYSYGPYGEPNNGGPARFRYTGQQYFANLGLYYYKARFYSPTLGKFMQTDPIGYASDLNLYAYVDGNPINYTDPRGLNPVAGAIAAVYEWYTATIPWQLRAASAANDVYVAAKRIADYGLSGRASEGFGGGGATGSWALPSNPSIPSPVAGIPSEFWKEVVKHELEPDENSHRDLRGGGDLQQNPGGKYSPLDVLPDSINGSPFISHGSPFDNLPKK